MYGLLSNGQVVPARGQSSNPGLCLCFSQEAPVQKLHDRKALWKKAAHISAQEAEGGGMS